MQIDPIGRTIAEVTHHRAAVNGTELHYVMAGGNGSPILLLHGFPESWWAFHRLIPLLAAKHRVIAVDMRGFGDSRSAVNVDDSAIFADDIHALIDHLGLDAVHLVVQDISGMVGFRLASLYPNDLSSMTAIESGLPGFGLELLADVTHGGAWYIGLMLTPGAPEQFFRDRETALIGDFIFANAVAPANTVPPGDIAEFARGYALDKGWSGAQALYRAIMVVHRSAHVRVVHLRGAGANFCAGGDVREFAAGKLAHYKIPRYVHVVEEFPMTVTGKVRKVAMRDEAVSILEQLR